MSELLAFQTFGTFDEADVLVTILKDNDIEAAVTKRTQRLDEAFIGRDYDNSFIVYISPSDFIKANEILNISTKINADEIPDDDPLNGMSNDELIDLVAKPDEWGASNCNTALALLEKRGVSIPAHSRSQLEEERIKVLSAKKSMNPLILFFGYLSCTLHVFLLFIKYSLEAEAKYYWYFPGLFGLLLGAIILQSKQTLPNGKRVVVFNNTIIRHGIVLISLSIIAWTINIFAFMFSFV